MAVKALNGVPGSGKTLNLTRIAINHYKRQNNIIKRYAIKVLAKLKIKKMVILNDYYNRFPYHRINNVYTNYPILLDKKHKIYSNSVDIWDLNNEYSFEPNALIGIDEVQLRVDSDEYKDKEVNKKIANVAKFLQAHRHFGIKDIYLISQHPSRIFKKARNVCEVYIKQSKLIKIPFTDYSLMKMTSYFNIDDYGKYIPRSREERKKLPFEYKKKIVLFNHSKVFKSFDSRYLSLYNYNKPLKLGNNYQSLKIEYNELEKIFNGNS